MLSQIQNEKVNWFQQRAFQDLKFVLWPLETLVSFFKNEHVNQLIFLIIYFYFFSGLLGAAISSHLLAECIGHLTNLVSLTLQYLATNIMLYSIAETCTKLHILDISYSTEVTDLGLLYLCGSSGRCGLGLDRYLYICVCYF